MKSIGGSLIGNSEAIASVRTMIRFAIKASNSVLITGASGCGKEVVARSIHEASDRGDAPFLAINSGAIPAELIESELFGHEAGSFTGASSRHVGIFEQAHGGTLFLDEIGEMPLMLQVKLLRVLEEGIIRRVGGREDIAIDVRIVAATNRDLRREMEEGRFREDLYYRLCVLPIGIAPLRDRKEDIQPLLEHFLDQSGKDAAPVFSADAIERLAAHDWPGNVRELRNLVDRALIFFSGQTVGAQDIGLLLDIADQMYASGSKAAISEPKAQSVDIGTNFSLQRHLQDEERRLMIEALTQCGGVIAKAARMVDIQRTTFVEKMRRHRISREEPSIAA